MIKKSILRIFLVVFAIIFFQFPLYVTLYTACLDGHLAENRLLIEKFQLAAKETNKTLDQYIAKFLQQDDLDFHHQGLIMRDVQARYMWLAKASSELSSSPSVLRPLIFLRYIDTAIAREAWRQYSIGVIINSDTVVWAVIGVSFGALLLFVIRRSHRFYSKRGKTV